nr:TonB-dependent siderophore receptor [Cytophagales bacterium]
MNYTALLALFLLFSGQLVFGQTIQIQATDASGTPIPGATLRLKENRITGITGPDGLATLSPPQLIRDILTISYIGFQSQSVEVDLSVDKEVRVQLQEQVSQLQQVEVFGRKETDYKSDYSFAATKIEARSIDVPQSISTITKELIQDQNIYRLNESVQNVAGVNQFSVYDDITMRGFRNSDYRLINGMRYIANFWSSPLLVNIERIEFIKGPTSALFSNSNPGGTINMVTKKPLAESAAALDFSVGSFNTMRTTADFTGKVNGNDNVLFRLNMGYENAGSFRDFINFNTLAVAPSVTFIASDKTTVNFDMSFTDYNTLLDRGRPTFQNDQNLLSTPINFNLNQPGDILRDKIFNGTLSVSHKLTENIALNASYMKYVDDQLLKEHGFNGYIQADSVALYFTERYRYNTSDNFTGFVTANFNTGSLSHKSLVGFDYIMLFDRNTEWWAEGEEVGGLSLSTPLYVNRNIGKYEPIVDEWSYYESQYITMGAYIQDMIQWKKLQVLLGLRYDRFTTPLNSWQFRGADVDVPDLQEAILPRIGMVYALKPNTNLYATFNQGYQPVDPLSNSNPRFGGPFLPEYSQLLEAGIKSQNFNDRLLSTFSVYQIEVNNVLVNANDPNNPDRLIQRGQERARGFELETTGRITSNLSVMATFAFNNAEITQSDDEDLIGLVKENAPQHISNTWIKYSIDRGKLDGLGFALGHSQVSERRTFARYTNSDEFLMLPGYVIFNAAAYYSVNKFRLSVNINNLTDKTHWIGGYNFQRNFPGNPRNFMVKVAYNL